jgi:hypothetical protein
MKSAIPVTCHCGQEMTLLVSGTQDPKDAECPACGTTFWFVKPLGNFLGMRIFNRAWAELGNGDFTLVIVLSAMAVECELARLFIKWSENELMNTGMPKPADTEALAEQWRKWNSIAVRLDKVSTLLVQEDLDSFLSHNPELLKSIHAKYPGSASCASPKEFFITKFFHKRNRIVHSGEIDFQQPDGEQCFTLAATLFEIMKEMDARRLKALDAKHAAQHN